MKNVKLFGSKRYFVIMIFILLATDFFSQDIIVKKDGDEIKAKVTEVSISEIKYKKHESPNGPIYTILKNDVFMIKYENGTKDVFKETQISETKSLKQQPKDLHKNAFILNLLGILQFGPILQLETAIGENVYLTPHLRIGNAGFLTYVVWDMLEAENSRLSGIGMGYGIGIKTFKPTSTGGLYFGGGMEYSTNKAIWSEGKDWETYELNKTLAVLGTAGYRWRFDNHMLLNTGALFGAATTLSDKEYYSATDELYDTYSEFRPLFMLELSFGWEF